MAPRNKPNMGGSLVSDWTKHYSGRAQYHKIERNHDEDPTNMPTDENISEESAELYRRYCTGTLQKE